MNPFPMRKIARLRQIHMEKVAMELQELDILRRGFQSNRDDRRRDLDSDEDWSHYLLLPCGACSRHCHAIRKWTTLARHNWTTV